MRCRSTAPPMSVMQIVKVRSEVRGSERAPDAGFPAVPPSARASRRQRQPYQASGVGMHGGRMVFTKSGSPKRATHKRASAWLSAGWLSDSASAAAAAAAPHS
jgi:hypothetical protein